MNWVILLEQTKIEKTCKRCNQTKPIEEFYTKRANKDGHDSYCKECCRQYARNFRKERPERTKEIAEKTRIKNREKIRETNRLFYEKTKNDPAHILARKATYERNKSKYQAKNRLKREEFNKKWKKPCEKCGETRLYLIQFHHIDPATKLFCIGSDCVAKHEQILADEVKKCVCLCSNCHDEFHYFYGSKPENPIEALNEYLKNGGTEE